MVNSLSVALLSMALLSVALLSVVLLSVALLFLVLFSLALFCSFILFGFTLQSGSFTTSTLCCSLLPYTLVFQTLRSKLMLKLPQCIRLSFDVILRDFHLYTSVIHGDTLFILNSLYDKSSAHPPTPVPRHPLPLTHTPAHVVHPLDTHTCTRPHLLTTDPPTTP